MLVSQIMAKVIRVQKRGYLAIAMLVLPFLLATIYGGCGSGTNNPNTNTCYLLSSSEPCFDPNSDGSTSTIIDQTVEEVISEQENMEGFQESLAITIIEEELAFIFPGTDPGCPYEQSELVIKTANDWNRFRVSCFFSSVDLPVIDFQNNIVFVSTQQFAGFGTSTKAALVFDNKLVVIVEDEVSRIPTPAPAYPISIVSVPRVALAVDFIRVEKDVTPEGF